MFEAMIRSLAQFRVFKHDDNGTVYGNGKLRVPDFRIVLDDGRQWLIEVKNVNRNGLYNQSTTMSANYVDSLRRYADAVGVPLMFAHYWSSINMWTVVAPDRFLTKNGGVRIDFLEAMRFSHMGDLGDTSISLPGPLIFKGYRQSNQGSTTSTYTWSVWRGEIQLTDPRDIRLANILIRNGSWPIDIPVDRELGDGAHEIEFHASVPEESENGFDNIGFASMIFGNFYRNTTKESGKITGILAKPKPEWFEPLRAWGFKSSRLQLRLFKISPSQD